MRDYAIDNMSSKEFAAEARNRFRTPVKIEDFDIQQTKKGEISLVVISNDKTQDLIGNGGCHYSIELEKIENLVNYLQSVTEEKK